MSRRSVPSKVMERWSRAGAELDEAIGAWSERALESPYTQVGQYAATLNARAAKLARGECPIQLQHMGLS